MSAKTPHVLYRFYDEDGSLLYIGITLDLPARMRAHRGDKPWWTEVYRIEIEHFDSRPEVDRAERESILNERPKYNVMYNKAPAFAPGSFSDPLIPDLVSLAEAARILGRAKQGVHRAALKGQIKCQRLDGGDGAWVFYRPYIEELAAKQAGATDPS